MNIPKKTWWNSGVSQQGYDAIWDDLLSQWNFNFNRSSVYAWPSVTDTYLDMAYTFDNTQVAGLDGNGIDIDLRGSIFVGDQDPYKYSFDDGSADTPFTISVWIKFLTDQASERYIFAKRGLSSNREYQFFTNTTNQLSFLLFSQGSNTNYISVTSATNAWTTNTWYNLTVTYDGSGSNTGLKIYKNGVALSTTNTSTGSYVKMTKTIQPLIFGNITYNNATYWLDAVYDNIAVWGRELSSDDVVEFYNTGTPLTRNAVTTPTYWESKLNIMARSGDYIFASDGSNLLWSTDNGVTYSTKAWGTQYTAGLPVYNLAIGFAYIFDDGTVLFATAAQLYRSTDGLVNINTVTAKNMDGSDYTFHTPTTSTRPGAYFWTLNQDDYKNYLSSNDEIVVFGNYCNNGGDLGLGASPVVVWYTVDKGVTVKALYKFGQNPNYRDDGTAQGGTTGTLLGDSGNSRITRHIHAVRRRPDTLEWYSCSGDIDTNNEIHILKHTYDEDLDTWSTSVVLNDAQENQRYKIGDFSFKDTDNLYFGVDATTTVASVDAAERGVFSSTTSGFGSSSTQIWDESAGAGTKSTEITDVKINRTNGKAITANYGADYSGGFVLSENYFTTNTRIRVPLASTSARPGRTSQLTNDYWSMQIGILQGPVLKTVFIKST